MRVAPRSIACPVAILSGLAVLAASVNSPAQERGRVAPGTSLRGVDDPRPSPAEGAVAAPRDVVAPVPGRASATLFEQGLADPRGCDYRAIEIAIGSVWSGDEGVATTHGWVLPARPGERRGSRSPGAAWSTRPSPSASRPTWRPT